MTPTELRILVLRFGEDLDLKTVAQRMGYATQTVYDMSARTIRKLHDRRFELLRALGSE